MPPQRRGEPSAATIDDRRVGTPRAAVGQLSAAFRQALQGKDVLDKLASMSLVPNYVDAEQYGVTMRQDSERLGRVIRTIGLKLE